MPSNHAKARTAWIYASSCNAQRGMRLAPHCPANNATTIQVAILVTHQTHHAGQGREQQEARGGGLRAAAVNSGGAA